ncbi:MAG: hypothetical protein Tsb009_27260 [Planctomycetaceae bacterium]
MNDPQQVDNAVSQEDVEKKFARKLEIYDRALATVKVLAIAVAGIWGLYQHFLKLDQARASREETAAKQAELKQRELDQRQRELDLKIFQEKRELYMSLCDVAAELAACESREEVRQKAKAFYRLYYGRSHLISALDTDVGEKKSEFEKALREFLESQSDETPLEKLGGPAFYLTQACQKHIDLNVLRPISARQ